MSDGQSSNRESSETTTALPGHRFRPGDVLAGRFVIVRFLAQGGMGEVYEATDSHLQGTHHALKTLRAEFADRPHLRERFEREVLLAREVHHPNVCPTYDIFHTNDERGPVTFLTMKLLRGESLGTRLRCLGPLEPGVVLSIARQMASALDAAHRRGVVHRDLKPGNVMLEDSAGGVNVSITDFGLSRAFEDEHTLAEPGQVLGTFGYIAPEVFQGRTAGYTADVYAFGVVVYEMLTGRKPRTQPWDPAYPPLVAARPGINPLWNRVVDGCLELDASKRYQSAGQALAEIDPIASGTRTAAGVVARRPRTKYLAAAAAVMVIALATYAFVKSFDRIFHALPEKRFVALMAWPADSSSPNQALVRNAIDTIGSRLSRAEASTKDLMTIAATDVSGQARLRNPTEAVSALGANLVLTTAVRAEGDGVALDLAVLDAASARPIRRRSEHVPRERLARIPDLASALAAGLLDVAVPQAPWSDKDELASIPGPAFQILADADDLASQPNGAQLDQAIEKYQRVLDANPKLALAYAKLSLAYGQKYQKSSDRAVLALAERNADSAVRFNPNSVTAVLSRALVDLFSGRADTALASLKRALELDPGNPQVLVATARTFRALNRHTDEEAVYRELLRNRPNFWPAYNELGLVLYRQARYQQAANVFAEGIVVAPKIVRLLNNLGAMQMQMRQRKEAAATYRRSVDAVPTAVAYQNLGTLAYMDGQYQTALQSYQKARDLSPNDEVAWRNLGDAYAMLGERDRMKESYAKAADIVAEALKINPKRGESWMTLALYQAKLGHRAEAESALRSADALGSNSVPSQLKKAQILALLGRRDDALNLLVDLLGKGLSTEDVDLAADLSELRKDPRYQRAAQAAPHVS
jgi:tetratricopeptide (TPR) repeat protein/tRNA A-37 threonylcarbamoyl transferase component Bud32